MSGNTETKNEPSTESPSVGLAMLQNKLSAAGFQEAGTQKPKKGNKPGKKAASPDATPVPKGKNSKAPSDEGDEKSPMSVKELTENQKKLLGTKSALTMSVQELAELVWPDKDGKFPAMAAAKAVLLHNFQTNSTGDDEVKKKATMTMVSKIFYEEDKKDMTVNDAILSRIEQKEKSQNAPKPKAQKGQTFKPKAESINEIFDTNSDTTSNAEALISMAFDKLPEDVWETVIGLVDTFANIAPAPNRGYAIVSKQKAGNSEQGTKGAFRRRVRAIVTPAEIIDACCNPKNINSQQLITRVTNPIGSYRAFLEFLESQAGENGAGLQWSWAQMLSYIKNKKHDIAKSIVDDAVTTFMVDKTFRKGLYGPLAWLCYPDLLLGNMADLNKAMKSNFIEENRGRLACPADAQISSPLVNIPLCGSECYAYMNFEQIQRRALVGLPWAKFAQTEFKIGRNPTDEQVRKLINKSATEYRLFLQRQVQGNRRYRQKTGRNSNKRFNGKTFDLGDEYTTI